MARKYPRFLYSDPKNTKSKGPFVVHLLHPRMICKFTTTHHEGMNEENKDDISIELLELFDSTDDTELVNKVMAEMLQWAWLNN